MKNENDKIDTFLLANYTALSKDIKELTAALTALTAGVNARLTGVEKTMTEIKGDLKAKLSESAINLKVEEYLKHHVKSYHGKIFKIEPATQSFVMKIATYIVLALSGSGLTVGGYQLLKEEPAKTEKIEQKEGGQ